GDSPQTHFERPPNLNVMLNCKQLAQLVSESYERPLSIRERLNLWMHVFMCGTCRAYCRLLSRLQRVIRIQSAWNDDEPATRLPDSTRERINAAIHARLSEPGATLQEPGLDHTQP
ncbi:MAG: hypothetical protein AB7Q45_26460, partial [Planctomycetaceae bacterium]